MYSIKEISEMLVMKPHVVRRQIKKLNLGQKVGGWNIVLTKEDIKKLEEVNQRKVA